MANLSDSSTMEDMSTFGAQKDPSQWCCVASKELDQLFQDASWDFQQLCSTLAFEFRIEDNCGKLVLCIEWTFDNSLCCWSYCKFLLCSNVIRTHSFCHYCESKWRWNSETTFVNPSQCFGNPSLKARVMEQEGNCRTSLRDSKLELKCAGLNDEYDLLLFPCASAICGLCSKSLLEKGKIIWWSHIMRQGSSGSHSIQSTNEDFGMPRRIHRR